MILDAPTRLALLALLLAALAFAALVSLRSRARERVRRRLASGGVPDLDSGAVDVASPRGRFRTLAVPLITLLVIGFAMAQIVASASLAFAIGAVAAIAVHVVLDARRSARQIDAEEKLADVVDLVVSALRAGVALLDALEAGKQEARPPLRAWLEEMTGRLRLGDAPAQVFDEMSRRIPLESYRLFCFILAVQWESGGSLAATLSTVGRSIRDRLEILRRVKAQAAEAQFSVIGVLGIVYVLGYLLWRADPTRMEELLAWPPGTALAIACIALQALGLVWMRRLAVIRL
jgi:tight adherence protein B